MSYELNNLGALADQYPAGGLFSAWLGESSLSVSEPASGELARIAAAPRRLDMAPLWESRTFAEMLPPAWRQLPTGPDVVVTGQQPGYFGGPLLTLYKIATAIVLARELTSGGRPTVPVFWSGDDDDDLAEALEPVGWDPRHQNLQHSPDQTAERRSGGGRTVLAALAADVWAQPALVQLETAGVLAAVPDQAREVLLGAASGGLNWGAGQAALIRAVFAGTDLVVVRGNDANLHAAAAPFYETLGGRLPELAALARTRGEQFVADGYHAQISERSLSRPLFRLQGEHREAIPDSRAVPAAELRPGVLLRSPVQDWLMQPVAVVVGPGELAYLRQIDPLYAALNVPRCPLVPRLSGWVLPSGAAGQSIAMALRPVGGAADPDADQLADQVATTVAGQIEAVLQTRLQLPSDRAADLAAGRARRFRKGLVAMFKTEITRREQGRLGVVPGWIMPAGQRQERRLGALSALGLWGEELVPSILAAATQHLASGRLGDWREWALLVPERTVAP